MRQRLSGSMFPSGNNVGAMWDNVTLLPSGGSTPYVVRSAGRMITHELTPTLSPTQINQTFKLISLSVQGYLVYCAFDQNNTQWPKANPTFGRLGRIMGGIFMDEPIPFQPTTPSSIAPYSILAGIPTNNTLTTTIWDPGVDSMPPSIGFVAADNGYPGSSLTLDQTLAIQGAITPPNPLDIISSTQISAAIWIEKNIYGTLPDPTYASVLCGLSIAQPTFTAIYDDSMTLP